MVRSMVCLLVTFVSALAYAGDIEWSGTYRFEGATVVNPELVKDDSDTTAYLLHHLVLRPKMTVYDGITIHGRFDLMNSDRPEYANSGFGNFLGSGVGAGAAATNAGNSNSLSQNQKSDFIQVNELYLNYISDYGRLIAGRAPLQFGLGMSYNGGFGEFDHWFDNRDLVSYEIAAGKLRLKPTIAKLSEGNLNQPDDVDDYMLEFGYDNPESDLYIGILYRRRHASSFGNDLPTFMGASSDWGSFDGEYWNFYFKRLITPNLKFALEGGIQKGETGGTNANGQIEMDGYGIAMELDYVPDASAMSLHLKAGIASGDDPSTTNTYEGYVFDRNYDVAMILFNRPLGQADFLRTGLVNGPVTGQTNTTPSSLADVEALSNALYISPSMNYKWSEKWQSQIVLTYAQLNSEPLTGAVEKDVGYEVDISLNYTPYKGVRWLNRVGMFMPGTAFEGGPSNAFDTETIFAIETKAAITF